MSVKTAVRHACARCGYRRAAGQMIYSRLTKKRYCIEMEACARRATRRKELDR